MTLAERLKLWFPHNEPCTVVRFTQELELVT